MKDDQSSYRQIFAATSLFGGVQLLQIIITIIRSKFIAVLLGTPGMGISGLLNSTIGLIGGLSNFGLGTSAVKNVAAAYASEDTHKIGTVVGVLRRLVWITGLLGALIMLTFSQSLSQLTFGNHKYTMAFVWTSVTLLFNQISVGQGVILRGTRKLKYMAQSALLGSLLGLIISVPIYYFWGIDGIVPAIIISSIVSLFLTWFFSNKVAIKKVAINRNAIFSEGKEMLKMGFMISLSSLFVLVNNFVVKTFISNLGGLEQVGLYTAGLAIVSNYVGMVFTAMSTDYYPRLSVVAQDNIKARKLMNEQAELAILIIAPIVTIFIVCISWIIILLYSDRFIPINDMVQWAILGMFFKASSWSIAFIFLAKGDSKLFLVNEILGGTITLIFNLLGYYFGGLTGMGIGFLLGYMYYTGQVYYITSRKYHFSFDKGFLRIFLIQFLIACSCYLTTFFASNPWKYIFGMIFISLSLYYSFSELNKRIDLWQLIKRFTRNIKSYFKKKTQQ